MDKPDLDYLRFHDQETTLGWKQDRRVHIVNSLQMCAVAEEPDSYSRDIIGVNDDLIGAGYVSKSQDLGPWVGLQVGCSEQVIPPSQPVVPGPLCLSRQETDMDVATAPLDG